MRYPRLADKQDMRRKLMESDIEYLKLAYAQRPPSISNRQWYMAMASEYGVSPSTIQYHTDMSYQANMKAKNAKAHSKIDMADYERHRANESKRRVERWSRNSQLRDKEFTLKELVAVYNSMPPDARLHCSVYGESGIDEDIITMPDACSFDRLMQWACFGKLVFA